MDKSKIEHLNPQDYTHLPHADQKFDDHEQTDVAIRPLVWTLISIAAIIVVTGVGMWGLFELYKSGADSAADNQQLSNVKPSIRQVPEGYPALQGVPAKGANADLPAVDMDEMREDYQLKLAGKKPFRPGLPNGMPIEQAMDEALSRGIFKTTAAGGGGSAGGNAAPATQQQPKPAAEHH